MELTYNPGPVTMDFLSDREARACLLIGPFGTGKSSAAAMKNCQLKPRRVLHSPDGIRRSRYAIVRNTYRQLNDTVIRTVQDWFPPHVFGRYLSTEKKYTLRFDDLEVELLFRALDDDADRANLLGLELTGGWIDEAREIDHGIVKGLMGRIGRYPSQRDFNGESPFLPGACQLDLTTNYPNRDHWLYRDFVSQPISGYKMYTQYQEENKHNLPPMYYDNLELDYADRPDLLKTLVRGEWGVTLQGKLVYPEFNRKLHVSDTPIKPHTSSEFVLGWDHTGLHPGCVVTQMQGQQWCILKEFWEEDVGIMDFGQMVMQFCNDTYHGGKFRHIGDPAGKNRDSTKSSPKDYLRKIGINIADGVQTYKIRREAVAGRLNKLNNGTPAICIDPACVIVIDGFEGGYAYKEIGSSGIFQSEPVKNKYADIHDALQYPATRLFSPSGIKKNEQVSFRGVFVR